LLMVLAQNFLVQGSEVLPKNPSVAAGGPAIPRIIEVQEQRPIWGAKICYRKAAK